MNLSFIPKKLEVVVEGKERVPGDGIYLETRDDRGPVEGWKWCIIRGGGGLCLNSDLEWEWEPMPSSRTEDFIARTRFTRSEAENIAGRLIATL